MKTSSGWRFQLYEDNQRFNEISTRIRLSRRVLDLMRSERAQNAFNCSTWLSNQIVCLWNVKFGVLCPPLNFRLGCELCIAGFSSITASDWRGYLPYRCRIVVWLRFQWISSQTRNKTTFDRSFLEILLNLIGITQQGLVANDDGLGLTHTSTWSLRTLF